MFKKEKIMIKKVLVILALCTIALPMSGLFSDKGSMGFGGGYSSGTSSYFSGFVDYCFNDLVDFKVGASFPSAYTPISMGANVYLAKPTQKDSIAIWFSPAFLFYNYISSGANVSVSGISFTGYLGNKISLARIDILPYLGLGWASATASATGYLSSTATATGVIMGSYFDFTPKASSKIIGQIEFSSSTVSGTTSTSTSFGLGCIF